MHNSEAVFSYSSMCSPQSAQDTLLDGEKLLLVGHRVVLPSRSSYIRFSRYKHPNFPPGFSTRTRFHFLFMPVSIKNNEVLVDPSTLLVGVCHSSALNATAHESGQVCTSISLLQYPARYCRRADNPAESLIREFRAMRSSYMTSRSSAFKGSLQPSSRQLRRRPPSPFTRTVGPRKTKVQM